MRSLPIQIPQSGGAGYSLFGQGVTVGSTLLEFNTSGVLTSPAATIAFHDQTANPITYANGVAATNSTIDFSGTTQYGSVSAVQSLDQNGYGPGSAAGIAIDEQGNLTANYTNGSGQKNRPPGCGQFPEH